MSNSRAADEPRGFQRWRESLQYWFHTGLTDAERATYQSRLDQERKTSECARCEAWRDRLVKTSPIIKFMLKEIAKIGRPVDPTDLHCIPCDETRSGGFSPTEGIIHCQNRFANRKHMEDTIAHELVHFYDDTKFKVDWYNCRHHACSEIRAASLSGDCKWTREILRGNFKFTKQHQACVKRRAVLSLRSNPGCSEPGMAEKIVAEVFESCFNDTRPFENIY